MEETITSVQLNSIAQPAVRSKISWTRILWSASAILAVLIYGALFYKRTFVGIVDRDAADIAQVARNLSAGRGYTTNFIRPLNVGVVGITDGRMQEANHSPLYLYLVAAAFRLRGASDQAVIRMSLAFWGLTVIVTYFLGRSLFDWRIGLLSAAAVGLSLPVLGAAVSGEQWTLAAFLFSLLLLAVSRQHAALLTGRRVHDHLWAALSAVILGLLFLTHWAFLFLIVPLAVYFGVIREFRCTRLIVFLVVAFLVLAPWAYRNVVVTRGSVLGMGAWDMMTHTLEFPEDSLLRSGEPQYQSITSVLTFPIEQFNSFGQKLLSGTARLFSDMGVLIGPALLGFGLVSVLYRFRVSSANAVRGLMYGTLPITFAVFALFGVQSKSLVIFAPVVAVFGAAYFMLLLDAKKLHKFYANVLTSAMVIVTCWPSLQSMLWTIPTPHQRLADEVSRFFASAGNRGVTGVIYTDVPWIAAWRTLARAVWIPRTDADIADLKSSGLSFNAVVLTSECDNYEQDETWYLIHNVKYWRDYIRYPEATLSQLVKLAKLSKNKAQMADKYFTQIKRALPISDAVSGMTLQQPDPFMNDSIQVYTLR